MRFPILLALRRTSRCKKVFVDPVLYSRLELSDEDGKFESTKHQIERLPDNDPSQHVRHLVESNTRRAYINSSKLQATSDEFRPGILEAVLEKLYCLQSFRLAFSISITVRS